MNNIGFLEADWPGPAGIVAGTSLRTGGVSDGVYASLNLGAHVDDRPASVAENRARLQRHLALPAEPAWLRQVHGDGAFITSVCSGFQSMVRAGPLRLLSRMVGCS